jgi:hypothetical protein
VPRPATPAPFLGGRCGCGSTPGPPLGAQPKSDSFGPQWAWIVIMSSEPSMAPGHGRPGAALDLVPLRCAPDDRRTTVDRNPGSSRQPQVDPVILLDSRSCTAAGGPGRCQVLIRSLRTGLSGRPISMLKLMAHRRTPSRCFSVTVTSPTLNATVPSCPYGSVAAVTPKGDDMRYIAPIVVVLALAACGGSVPHHATAVASVAR